MPSPEILIWRNFITTKVKQNVDVSKTISRIACISNSYKSRKCYLERFIKGSPSYKYRPSIKIDAPNESCIWNAGPKNKVYGTSPEFHPKNRNAKTVILCYQKNMTNWHASKSTERTLARVVAYTTTHREYNCWVFPSHSPIWYGHKVRHRTMTSNLHLLINYTYASHYVHTSYGRAKEQKPCHPTAWSGDQKISRLLTRRLKIELLVVCRERSVFIWNVGLWSPLMSESQLFQWSIICTDAAPCWYLNKTKWSAFSRASVFGIYIWCDSIGMDMCLHRLPCSCCKFN